MSQSSSSSDDAAPAPFATRADADAARTAGVKLFNEGNIDGAIAMQERVLGFFTTTFGEMAPECGIPYLDYGVSLLAAIQAIANDDAVLAGNGVENEELEEDLRACFETIELAKLCFQKGVDALAEKVEKAKNGSEEKKKAEEELAASELRLAEAFQTAGDFCMESDDEEGAIEAFGEALELREKHLPESHKLILSLHFSIAKAYADLQIYEQATAELEKAIAKAESAAPSNNNGNSDPQIVTALKEALEDIKQLEKAGGLEAVRKEVEEMFPNEQGDVDQPLGAATNGSVANRKIYGEVPKDSGNEDSLQLAADVVIPFLPTDASNSMSHFPSQGHNKSNSQKVSETVNKAVVIRSKKTSTITSPSKENNSINNAKESGVRRERQE